MATTGFAYPDVARVEMHCFVPQDAKIVLDVGCAGGAFGAELKRSRAAVEVHGVEPDCAAAEIAAGRLEEVFKGFFPDALPAAYRNRKYDCVVFNDVLEHVMEPEVLLYAAHEVIRPGGCIVVSIPNVRYAPISWGLAVFGRWEYRDQGVLDRTHVRFYTRRSIQKLLSQTGWSPSHITRLNVPGSRRAPALGWILEKSLRDLSCPQFAFAARADGDRRKG